TASALLMLNTRGANVVNVAAVIAGLPSDTNAIKSEIDVLESRALAARVIADLGLAGDSEFAPSSSGKGLLAVLNPLSWLPREWPFRRRGVRRGRARTRSCPPRSDP